MYLASPVFLKYSMDNVITNSWAKVITLSKAYCIRKLCFGKSTPIIISLIKRPNYSITTTTIETVTQPLNHKQQ
jgi:hypothetical protein